MDARAATDVCGSSVRRSRVVPTPRCWRRWQRAVHWGEHEVSRKAIAQGKPECSRCPVCSCAVLFAQIEREAAGAASTRSSLRPLTKRAGVFKQTLGAMRRENAKSYPPSLRAKRSNPPLRLLRFARNDAERIVPQESVARMSEAISGTTQEGYGRPDDGAHAALATPPALRCRRPHWRGLREIPAPVRRPQESGSAS
jgi:hypothetical protein